MKPVVPVGSKFFYGVGVLAALAAIVSSWGSHGGLSGGASFGLLGGIGDHSAVVVLAFLAVTSAFLGGVTTAFRDADPDAAAAVARLERLPEATPATLTNYWPVIAAVAAGVMMVGLVSSPVLFRFAAIFEGVALFEWVSYSWADRATGDPVANREIRNRFMNPVEIPVFGGLGIIVLVLCVSRVLLAVSDIGSDIVAVGVATVVMGTATLLSFRPTLKRPLVGSLVAVFGLVVIVAGIVGAAHGSREYEKTGGKEGTTTTTAPASTTTTASGLAGPVVFQ